MNVLLNQATGAQEDWILEVSCKWLAFRIELRGGQVRLSTALMDDGDRPQLLLRTADAEVGWKAVCRVVRALEESRVKSLRRPIEAGTGADAWLLRKQINADEEQQVFPALTPKGALGTPVEASVQSRETQGTSPCEGRTAAR